MLHVSESGLGDPQPNAVYSSWVGIQMIEDTVRALGRGGGEGRGWFIAFVYWSSLASCIHLGVCWGSSYTMLTKAIEGTLGLWHGRLLLRLLLKRFRLCGCFDSTRPRCKSLVFFPSMHRDFPSRWIHCWTSRRRRLRTRHQLFLAPVPIQCLSQ